MEAARRVDLAGSVAAKQLGPSESPTVIVRPTKSDGVLDIIQKECFELAAARYFLAIAALFMQTDPGAAALHMGRGSVSPCL